MQTRITLERAHIELSVTVTGRVDAESVAITRAVACMATESGRPLAFDFLFHLTDREYASAEDALCEAWREARWDGPRDDYEPAELVA